MQIRKYIEGNTDEVQLNLWGITEHERPQSNPINFYYPYPHMPCCIALIW